ncbi:hypothetical protein [uncultured Nonlabens sp.]|uniref:hypothetical protein n=1 Tax=uncultured Nonlabens sp. TaxID=859306 RepID=UPI002639B65D|nr:hypothetical protein [uncultured Nonlabens sp.]
MKKTIITTLAIVGLFTITGVNAQETYQPADGVNTGVTKDINGTADDLKDEGIVGVSGWSSFNTLSNHVYMLEGQDFTTTREIIPLMSSNIMILDDTIPEWLMTEEIMEDVKDVQKDYVELMKGTKMSSHEFKENLEEVIEQYEDLREEVGETVEKYNNVQADAMEEYMEEIESDRSYRKNMRDASEEYEEEIKGLNKITDLEMKK